MMLNTLKDFSVIYSFDNSGYKRHAKQFMPLNEDNIVGKHYLITGGTSGIGAALAKRLMNAGATVTVTGRHEDKFKNSEIARTNCSFIKLDMANFASVLQISLPKLDGLVCNAGGMPSKLTTVDSKYDLIFASQVVGHYILIKRCITEKILRDNAPVHINSSGGMYLARLRLDDLCWQHQQYDKIKSYANAKRAQVVLNQELPKLFETHHFSCSHPGWVGTKALAAAMPDFVQKFGDRLRTVEEGADTIYWCLAQYPNISTGKFWFDRRSRWIYPFFWTRERKQDRQKLLRLCDGSWVDSG